MSQTADIQPLSLEQILEILRNQAIATPNPVTSTRYLRALDSLQSTLPMEWRRPRLPEPTNMEGAISERAKSDCSESLSPGDTESDNSSLIIDHLSLALTDWLVSLWLTATPFATASLYLDIISSLYGSAAKATLLPPTKLFSQLKSALKELGPQGWKQGIGDEIFARALRLTKNARCLIADDATAAQLVIHSLTHSLLPLTEVALLKKSDIPMERRRPRLPEPTNMEGAISERAQSVDSMLRVRPDPTQRSRYLFPLRQSQRTPKQLSQHIAKIVNALFKRARLPQATDPYQTVEALWAYAALRAGIPASTLVAHLGHVPLGLPVLKLSSVRFQVSEESDIAMERRRPASPDPTNMESAISERAKSERTQNSSLIVDHLSLIGNIFLENPPRWYAMQLRPGVRFTQVCRRIQLLHSSIFPLPSSDLQLFYPCEEIARAIGKKIVTRQRPFIHSVVFFRAKLTDIGRLFSKIGDLAWCYRQSARPGAPYAEITDSQFQLFQQTIARFTPDYEVAATGELELKEGDRVEILGGLFAGQEATVMEGSRVKVQGSSSQDSKENNSSLIIDHSSLSGTVYRLSIIGDNGIEWRINADPRLLKAPKP